MQYIPRQIIPSPLAGLEKAAGTLADAIIKSKEKQAFMADSTLVGQVLAQVQGGGQEADPTAWQRDPGVEVPFGDVPEPAGAGGAQAGMPAASGPRARAQTISLLSGLLPQMKSQAGQKMVGEVLTKMIMTEKQDVSSYYNPETGETKQFPGKLVVAKPEDRKKVQTVKVQEGGEEVTYQINADGSWTEIGRGPKWNPKEKEAKQHLLEDEGGNLAWFPEGEEIPKGWSKPAAGGKKGLTGRTKEGVDFLKLMGLDPTKAENWKFVKETLGRGNTDVSKWAMQQVVNLARGNYKFTRMTSKEKKNYIKEQATSFMDLAEEMQGRVKGGADQGVRGQPAAGKAGKPPSYPPSVQGPGGVYTQTGQFDPATGKPIYKSPDGRLMLPK